MNRTARIGKTDGIRQQIVEYLAHAGLVGNEMLGVFGNRYVQREPRTQRRFAHTKDCSFQNRAYVDRAEFQLHGASVDRCKIENVVDDGK